MSRHFRIGLCCTVALVALTSGLASSVSAAVEDAKSYASDAKARVAKGDLRGAEIELRNAAQANPSDPSVHIQLAQLYLDMQNLPAAEAEARLARQYKGPADQVDPLLAKALLQQNKFTELFRDVSPGNRGATAESEVRLSLGLAHLALQETDQAEPMLRDAEHLDPNAAAPKTAMAEYLVAKSDFAAAQKEVDAAAAITPDDPNVFRISAQILRSQGNTDGAIAKLSTLLAKRPNDMAGLVARADAFMSVNKLDQAKADLARAMTLAPSNLYIIYLDGLLLTRQGKFAEADAQLSKIVSYFNDLPAGYYLEGIVKYRLGQYQQAAASLSKYVVRFPNVVEPRQLIARIDLSQRNFSDAITVLKPAAAADPTDVTTSLLLAEAYLSIGQRNDALDLFSKAAAAHPDNVALAANLAAFRTGAGEVRQGLAELDKLAQTTEGEKIVGPTLVVADLHAGRISDAATIAESIVQHNNKDLLAQSLLANVRLAQGRYADAAAILQTVADRDPSLLAARRSLAEADLDLNKLDDAKSVLTALVKDHPDSIVDQIALARAEARQGDLAGATTRLKAAQAKSLDNPDPGLALLAIYRANQQWQKAEAYGRDLEGQFPASPAVLDMIAALRSASGDKKGAAAEFRKLVQAKPDQAGVLLRYATYQRADGDSAGARESLHRAVALAPRNVAAIETLVSFEFDTDGVDAALAAARSFANQDPQMAQFLAADVLQRSGRYGDAIALLKQELKERPTGIIAAKLGEVLYASGQHDEAKRGLQEWIKGHTDVASLDMLGTIYMTEHDENEAKILYGEVHDQSPDDAIALNNLAIIYAQTHDARALEYAADAFRVAPSPNTGDTFGWMLASYGRPADGIPLLQNATAADPQNPSFAYHLAAALSASGRPGEARTVLERALASGSAFQEKSDAQHLLDKLSHG